MITARQANGTGPYMLKARDELLHSNVKGRNPFKDKRVRQALYQAIDIDANMNAPERLNQIHEALLAHNAETNHLPLHRQVIPWAARGNITAVHRADNNVVPYWVTIQ